MPGSPSSDATWRLSTFPDRPPALAGPKRPTGAAARPASGLTFARELARAQRPYMSPLKQRTPAQRQPTAAANTTPQRGPGARGAGRPTRQAATTGPTERWPNAWKTTGKTSTKPPVRKSERATGSDATSHAGTPLPLDAYPHPNHDNGRGLHWIPTTEQTPSVIDRFVAEAQRMGVKWVTFLNEGANIGQNDYLVKKLVGAGIEPVMRIYARSLEPIQGDLEGMVRHYTSLGVNYFQPYNEPNLRVEQPDGNVSVDRYLDNWIPAARAVLRGGGLPGFGALSPGGDLDDLAFLRQALDGLRSRGELGLLDRGWLSMHNYTHNHPIAERDDSDGFFKFRAYHHILREALGRDLPIIGTEGGTFIGEHEDASLPAIDAHTAVDMARQAFSYMRDQREPWNFASSYWVIANEAGGGQDAGFAAQALFGPDGKPSAIAAALRSLA